MINGLLEAEEERCYSVKESDSVCNLTVWFPRFIMKTYSSKKIRGIIYAIRGL